MANIVITKVGTKLKVELNNVANQVGDKIMVMQIANCSITLSKNDDFVNLKANTGEFIHLVYASPTDTAFLVDTVAGVAPTSNLDLFNKIDALL